MDSPHHAPGAAAHCIPEHNSLIMAWQEEQGRQGVAFCDGPIWMPTEHKHSKRIMRGDHWLFTRDDYCSSVPSISVFMHGYCLLRHIPAGILNIK